VPSALIIATIPLLLALTQAAPRPADGDPVVSEIVVDAPMAAVWDAYTNTETMRAWQVARMSPFELRVGARWRASYTADAPLDDADPTVIENELLAFDPGRMLAVRTVRAPADFPFPRAILGAWTVLYLEPVGESRTRVVTRMFGFTADEESQGMRAFFERGNAYELRQLAEHLARR
jgi:uncharacterized protein YndB with AHSA1/START domain